MSDIPSQSSADLNGQDSLEGIKEEIKQLAEKIKAASTNDLGALLPVVFGLGSLTPSQAHYLLQCLSLEVTARLNKGDFPTDLQSGIHLLRFYCSSGLGERHDLWKMVEQNLGKMACKALIVCLAASQRIDELPPWSVVQGMFNVFLGIEDGGLETSDWVLLLETVARLRINPGTDHLLSICKSIRKGVDAGAKDGMPASDVSGFAGGLMWAVVMLAPLSNIRELLATQLEILHVDEMKSHWKTPALSKLLAGLAYASALDDKILKQLNFKDLDSSNLDEEALGCLAHAYLAMPSIANYLPHNALLDALTFQKQRVASPKGNEKAKLDLTRVLTVLGTSYTANFPACEGLLNIDIAIPGGRIALMLPSNVQFCMNMNTQPLGSTHLEWKFLAAEGWKVVALPVSLWEAQTTIESQVALLRKAIHDPPAIEIYQALSTMIPRKLLGPSSRPFPKGGEAAPVSQPSTSQRSSEVDLKEPSRQDLKPRSPSVARSAPSHQDSSTAFPLSPRSMPQTRVPSSLGIASDSRAVSVPDSKSGEELRHFGSASLQESNSGTMQPMVPPPLFPNFDQGPFADPTTLNGQFSLAESEFAALRVGPQQLGQSIPSQDFSSQISGFNPDARLAENSVPPQIALQSLRPHMSADLASWPSGGISPGSFSVGSQNLMYQPPASLPSIGSGPPFMPMARNVPSSSMLQTRNTMPQKSGDLRSLWHSMVTQQVDHSQAIQDTSKRSVSVADLKRVIDTLPLETSAVSAVASRLAQLTPEQFAVLLTELARDNHAFRAWQLFDWVRALPDTNELRRLCDSHTYTTMISLCGPWQQVRRALNLIVDMKQKSLQCDIQAYAALLNAAVKCGEVDLAVDIYNQMSQEGMSRDRHIFQTMVDIFVKMGRHSDALGVLDDMKASGQQAEVQLYNLIVLSCTKVNNPKAALDVYKRMAANGVQPNTKTFTALIGSVGKMSTLEQAMDVIDQLLCHEKDTDNLTSTYSALMSACEKAGQWDLAVALFDKMSSQGCKPDVSIFNSMIAACAHGGEYVKARLMFDRMAEHGCTAEAVTYANLIRAYKKGGQWCHALDTFEAMQRSGCGPHAAVFSSIIDVLWQTGISWAQAKALDLFNTAVKQGNLAGAAESCKKGTLKVDLQALTVGVAVLSMASWLDSVRLAIAQDKAGSLDSARKLAIVNGLGEHSRAQGHSAAVKEAVGAGLLGCHAPFKLVQDHSRSGRLESSTLALRKWLFSESFNMYHSLIHGGPEEVSKQMISTEQYLKKEVMETEHCFTVFRRIQRYESSHPVTFKLLHNQPGNYLALRKQLVHLTLQEAIALQLNQEIAHTALALMDRCVLAGMQVSDHLQPALVCTCLRVAAVKENACLLSPYQVHTITHLPVNTLEHMETTLLAALQGDTDCISSIHCLKTYLQRLGVDLGSGKAVKLAAGCAFALATHALGELPIMQFTPSLTAAAILVAARKAQGSVPFWPSVLAQMTGYTEASNPAFASAINHADRLHSRIFSTEENSIPAEGMLRGQISGL